MGNSITSRMFEGWKKLCNSLYVFSPRHWETEKASRSIREGKRWERKVQGIRRMLVSITRTTINEQAFILIKRYRILTDRQDKKIGPHENIYVICKPLNRISGYYESLSIFNVITPLLHLKRNIPNVIQALSHIVFHTLFAFKHHRSSPFAYIHNFLQKPKNLPTERWIIRIEIECQLHSSK